MAKRVKVKEIKQVIGASGEGINSMFEEMMGLKDCDISIILPKFIKVRNYLRHIHKILVQFSNFAPIRSDFSNMTEALDQISAYAAVMKDSIVFGTTDCDETEETYASVSKTDLNNLYKKLKENTHVRQLIVLCGKLKQYSKYFEDINNLKDNFIGQEPGLSLIIFDFSTLDLKHLWASPNIKPMIKKYVLSILHYIYCDLFQIYKITTSPDVDIDKFTEVLLNSIGQLKKQPGLNRCNNAFKRIESSVELLKGNFDGYYRESIASANPNMIVESFIIDVSNQGGADARLTREFRQIIQYMHKVSAQNGRNKDPNVQKLFSMLNQNFALIENKTGASSKRPAADSGKDLGDVDLTLKSDVATDVTSGTDATTGTTGAETLTEINASTTTIGADTVTAATADTAITVTVTDNQPVSQEPGSPVRVTKAQKRREKKKLNAAKRDNGIVTQVDDSADLSGIPELETI